MYFPLREEIRTENEALLDLSGGDEKLATELVSEFGGVWRRILRDFEADHGRVPTKDELIWCFGTVIGQDPEALVAEPS